MWQSIFHTIIVTVCDGYIGKCCNEFYVFRSDSCIVPKLIVLYNTAIFFNIKVDFTLNIKVVSSSAIDIGFIDIPLNFMEDHHVLETVNGKRYLKTETMPQNC